MASAKKPAKKATPKSARINKHSSADAADNQLKLYRSIRDFKVTGEPSGSRKTKFFFKTGGSLPFVIQKHAASHLHYDFRLGWNKVLKSWAVAKGPSYYPGDRRLAVQVEDHPWDYRDFEGIIPKGQYGGGTVMVWDTGIWEPQKGYEDVTGALRDGSLKFILKGKKLKGKWTLVRMKPREGSRWGNNGKPNWLLIKEHDDYERGKDAPAITDEAPNSAVTGRTMEQIAAAEDHIWNSNKTTEPAKAVASSAPRKIARATTKFATVTKKRPSLTPALSKLPRESQPGFIPPQLALEATAPPEDDGWLHELKLDGYRIQARKSGSKVELLTRKGLDWTKRMPAVAQAVAALKVKSVTLDGEVVVLDKDGISSFAALQASFQHTESHPLTYFVFDLLHLDGRNPRDLPLRERKALLEKFLPRSGSALRLCEHIEGDALKIFRHACKLHAEGIISKRASAPYRSTRSSDWLKSKCLREQELVIGGYTLSSEGTDRIGSLLLGYYKNSTLIYAGRTGTGFTQQLKRSLLQKLAKLHTAKPAFESVPTAARKGAHWIKPKLVAQVRFATWTADNLVRQAAFLGLREDKAAAEVSRESATVAPRPKASHSARAPIAAKVIAKSNEKANLKADRKSAKTATAKTDLTQVRLTHPDKILDPETGVTKQQLADYYVAIAPYMLPHITGRPLSLVRCPNGAGKPCFYQKHVTGTLPLGIGSVKVTTKKTGELEPYITLDTEEALASLAQLSALEVHPWGSRNDDLEHPDRLIFDFDPDESLPWTTLTGAVAEVRKRLKNLGLESFLKLTGGKGLHVVAPVEATLTWPEIKEFAHKLVLVMERDNPQLFLTKMTKAARTGKIFLDYLRNERGATAVAPFSPRARLSMPVSLPLPWSALKETRRPVFHVHDFASWRSRLRNDPWKSMPTHRQRLDPKKIASM